ncbi:MAG: nucleotidyl transferase AbiEii/AbiGii toxin family protein [Actinobacteria bacterium]|nr:nucleotidyl transferase AbiEii/AbiGii toxin family protein [Actinomycetota bacterium]
MEFLRWFGHKTDSRYYALKGGVNMRFFFGSIRYSEDMDLDLSEIKDRRTQDIVLKILGTRNFIENLRPYGIQGISIPDIPKAKQTETTQRFKIHLMTFARDDLFTKVEFSRRGLKNGIVINAIPDSILRAYKMIPVIVPHYDALSATAQKINALASRPAIQARDIFDLYILSPLFSRFPSIFVALDNELPERIAASRVVNTDRFNSLTNVNIDFLIIYIFHFLQ